MRIENQGRRPALLALLGCLFLGGGLAAQEQSVAELLKKVAALEARVTELETERAESPSSTLESQINALARSEAYRADELTATWADTLRFTSADKAFDIKVSGRIQTDFIFGTQDDDFENTFGEIGDYVEFRRVRIGISGTIYQNVFFKTSYDFAQTGLAGWRDIYLGVKDVPVLGQVFVGQFFVPFSIDQHTSSNYYTFLERATAMEAFSPDRQTGIMNRNTALDDDRLFWSVALYRQADASGDSSDDDLALGHDGEWNLGARIAYVAIKEDDGATLFMFGGAFNYRNPDEGIVRFTGRPEMHTPQGKTVDTNNGTGDIVDADEVMIFQVEAAVVLDAFSATAEFIYVRVDSAASGDPDFWGGYVELSYFLTGEHKTWDKSQAAFGRIRPNADFGSEGSGAWQLAARFSYIDLEDELVTGGRNWNVTAGVNWILNPSTRVRFNYVYSDTDDGPADGVSHWFGFRFQVDF